MQYQAYDSDVTDEYLISPDDAVVGIALEREDQVVIFVGNTADRTVTTSLRFFKDVRPNYSTRSYNSLRGEWIVGEITRDELRGGIALEIDRHGFCVLELNAQSRPRR